MTTSRDLLLQEIDELQRRLDAKKRALHELDKIEPLSDGVQITSRQFTGKKLAVAVAEYLELRNGKATLADVFEAMRRGSADLGTKEELKLKHLKIAVSMNTPKLFTVEGGRSAVKEREPNEVQVGLSHKRH